MKISDSNHERIQRAIEGPPLAPGERCLIVEDVVTTGGSVLRAIEVVRGRAQIEGGVVTFDLSETGIESANKFLSYFLFPAAAYTVVVTRDAKRSKVSVGSNPWARPARPHDISKLCERYGGGGHPVVGAVSLPPDHLDDARRVAGEIAATLRIPPAP